MSIKALTIEQVNIIENQTGDPFYVATQQSVPPEFFKGYMFVKFPGRFFDFEGYTDFSHRQMYDHTDHNKDLGEVDGNTYVLTVLDLINNHLGINDSIWEYINNNNIDFTLEEEDED